MSQDGDFTHGRERADRWTDGDPRPARDGSGFDLGVHGAMTLAAGTRLGPYEILSPLGAGGMGEVYRARDTKLGREVAIKVLPQGLADDADRLARFEREARLLASLHHPYILSILDFGRERGTTYAVTELLEGETLRTRLVKGSLPFSKTLEYAREIAQGLSAAHAKGVVHRDLKPENLFITKDGGIKILDFGLARRSYPAATQGGDDLPTLAADPSFADLRTSEGVVLGTVGYMAPEQVRGETADARSDIFSFGAVCYEMLTGERAFRRDSALETLAAIARDDPPEMSASGRPIPAPLEHVVRRCLEKSPDDRFQSARDLVFALEEASHASDPSMTLAPSRPGRANRRRVALLAIVAAVAIASALLALFWYQSRAATKMKAASSVAPAASSAPSTLAQTSAPSAKTVPGKSIAVLPFANESGDPSQRYFSDGLSEDLIIALNQYPKLKVIGRDSSFQLRDSHLDSKAIGKKLGVAHLLEGSVSRAGDEVRVRAELVNAADGTTLWSHHYDRPYKDLFALQDDITKAVASALEAKL
ncbi:MAG TPA: serine/threonine-protein kinase, partial [Thermoanaerobaculia bacterium]|nr:serine/threonine-protein kinase [Thermoanaerobaculia bacterium]